MALDGTYTGLQASVADWLNRKDITAAIPDFITLAEAQFNRELRVINMETFSTGTSSASANGFGTVGVPVDWLETRSFRVDQPNFGMSGPMEYVGEEELDNLLFQGLAGDVRYYTIINGEFQIQPAPSGAVTYDLRYYAKIPPLATSSSNWLLTKSPDLYLYSSCLQAAPYLKDDERVATWGAIRAKLITDIQYESERAKRPTTRLRTRKTTYG